MLTLIVWLLVGALVGWLASLVMGTDWEQGGLLNIVVGIAGAFVAGLLFGGTTINQGNFSTTAIVASLIGALVLLGVVNLFRRGTVR
jgi:uncharacterized membrane protein YeaQ/YmgE (transglycosylase-associated protein family)